MRLVRLEALVEQRRRVNGNLAPHLPGRVMKRFLGSDVVEVLQRKITEGAAGGSEDQPARRAWFAPQTLPDSTMFTVNRTECPAAACGRLGEWRSGTDQDLLVGHG